VPSYKLPSFLSPHEDIREATLAENLSALDHSFGSDAPSDYGCLVIEHDVHLIHVIGDQLDIRIGRLLETFQILLLCSDSAAGVGKDKFLGFDAIKEHVVTTDIRLPMSRSNCIRSFFVCSALLGFAV
jgi:hypothetical protein